MMSKIDKISLPGHVEDLDKILAGIDQARYLEAIQNSWTSVSVGNETLSDAVDNIYLFSRPEYVLALAITEGKDLDAALDQWIKAVGELLAKYRKSRRKSILFEVASTMVYCDKEFPLKLETIELALATLAVYQSREIQFLLDELTASSIPLEGWNQPPRLELAEVAENYLKFLSNCSCLKEEHSNYKSVLDLQKGQLSQLVAERIELSNMLKESSGENELLLLQLHQIQEELESINLERKQQTEVMGQHQAELKNVPEEKESLSLDNYQLKDELDKLKGRLVEFESKYKEVEGESKELREENELLILQLHQVQEELEQYYLKLQATSIKEHASVKQKADAEFESSSPSQPKKLKKRSKLFHKIVVLNRLRSEAALLKSSTLFDGTWYLQRYPDVESAKVNPVRHYLRFGAAEGRNPGPEFNTQWYLKKYPDVAESGLNPLVHYLKYGMHEGRMKTGRSWN